MKIRVPAAFAVFFLPLALQLACSRNVTEPSGTATTETKAQEVSPDKENKQPSDVALINDARLPGAPRVVAIGDLHGDFQQTRRAFRLAGAIGEDDRWVGGKLVIVQTGDQLDRGDDESRILEFLKRLKSEAKAAGGAVHVLNGNHETMNVQGDFRYVTPAGLRDFADIVPASPYAGAAPELYRLRASAFLPGGGAALELAAQPLILIVGDTVFAHGGVLPAHIDYGIDRMNRETREWMEGGKRPPEPVLNPEGPLWTRLYGTPSLDERACKVLKITLERLSVKRMVVGHTVQARGMSGACDNQVFRIDVGLSGYYGDHPVQVLVIENGQAKILTEN